MTPVLLIPADCCLLAPCEPHRGFEIGSLPGTLGTELGQSIAISGQPKAGRAEPEGQCQNSAQCSMRPLVGFGMKLVLMSSLESAISVFAVRRPLRTLSTSCIIVPLGTLSGVRLGCRPPLLTLLRV
eukprot:4644743-Amphidinium_carterae.2